MPETWRDKLVRFMADVALTLHFLSAAGWWWLSPKGYPFDRSQFWINSVLPVAAMTVAAAGIIALHIGGRRIASGVVLAFTGAWCAAALAGRIVFPVSLADVWVLFLLAGLAGAVLFALLVRGGWKSRPAGSTWSAWPGWLACGATGAIIGAGLVSAEIPRPVSTRPLDEWPAAADGTGGGEAIARLAVGDNGQLDPQQSELILNCGNMRLVCRPLLEFHRVSPDRFWSLLAPRDSGTRRQCTRQFVKAESRLLEYDDGAVIELPSNDGASAVEFSAYAPLESDTYSHLNSFCLLEIGGHRELSLAFSPCAGDRIDVLPADYPFGRPARMAYLDAAGEFHVVEATSGEKGPFRPLASGRLQRGEPLTITVYDAGRRVWAVTLADWSAQASTDLSPSAGWGLPTNAIEFQRHGDALTARATVWITLAGTAVGRGFETVGHRAGVYRNRMVIDCEPAQPSQGGE